MTSEVGQCHRVGRCWVLCLMSKSYDGLVARYHEVKRHRCHDIVAAEAKNESSDFAA